MRLITNPKHLNCPIKTIFEGAIYEIAPGETVSFDKEHYRLADFLLETYGFLVEETAEDKPAPAKEKKDEGPFVCQYCGKVCKSRIGLLSHERSCSKRTSAPKEKEDHKAEEPKAKKAKEVKVIKPKAFLKKKPLNRSEKENVGFNDMPSLTKGIVKKEMIGGRIQEVVYDSDGVGWYGPGLQNDIVADFRKRRSGHGNF